MAKTVAIYQQTEDGLLQLGTFTPHKFYSARSIGEQFRARYPNVRGKLFMARRINLFGRYVDSADRISI